MEIIEINNAEFNQISNLVYKKFGINLTEAKTALVKTRLQKVLRQMNFNSFSDYYGYLVSDKSGLALSELVNHISTNHTYFFRENEHFSYFSNELLPKITKMKREKNIKDIRIWSAGCSTGEEPFMLVILMKEFFGNEYSAWNAGVLATDISLKVLEMAAEGIFPYDKLNNLPTFLLNKYFDNIGNNEWKIKNEIIKEVTFRRFNLMNHQFPFKKKFDIIFCRNVMIYFDTDKKKELIEKFHNFLENDGMLFLGHSETLNNISNKFKYIVPAGYQKSDKELI